MSFFDKLNEALFKKPERFIRRKVGGERIAKKLIEYVLSGTANGAFQNDPRIILFDLITEDKLSDILPKPKEEYSVEEILKMKDDAIVEFLKAAIEGKHK